MNNVQYVCPVVGKHTAPFGIEMADVRIRRPLLFGVMYYYVLCLLCVLIRLCFVRLFRSVRGRAGNTIRLKWSMLALFAGDQRDTSGYSLTKPGKTRKILSHFGPRGQYW